MKHISFLPLALLFAIPSTHAAVVQIPITSATLIRNNTADANRNYGAYNRVIVGTTGTADVVIRSLFAASLAEIPVGSTINSITLNLYSVIVGQNISNDADVPLELHLLTAPFVEGSGNQAGNSTLGATWNNANAVASPGTSVPWSAAGGDFVATPLSTVLDNPSTVDHSLTFASTSAFVAAAQAALDGNQDLSLILKLAPTAEANGSTRNAFFFVSDEGTANYPYFSIDYTIPEPASFVFALSGLGTLILRRRR